jgi:hypothetical protein
MWFWARNRSITFGKWTRPLSKWRGRRRACGFLYFGRTFSTSGSMILSTKYWKSKLLCEVIKSITWNLSTPHITMNINFFKRICGFTLSCTSSREALRFVDYCNSRVNQLSSPVTLLRNLFVSISSRKGSRSWLFLILSTVHCSVKRWVIHRKWKCFVTNVWRKWFKIVANDTFGISASD